MRKRRTSIGPSPFWKVINSRYEAPDSLFTYGTVILGYFNSVSDALEIKARTQLVNEKITYAAELQSVLRQLLTEVRT